MENYKIGDKVRILQSDEFWRTTDEEELENNFMCAYCGKTATITKVFHGTYHLDIDGEKWWWKPSMFKIELKDLKDLKVGDLVVLDSPYIRELKPIQRVTNTQIIVDGTKFRKSGSQIGSDIWHPTSISIATEEDIKQIKKEKLKREMKNTIIGFSEFVKSDKVPFEDMERVYYTIVQLKNK